MFAVTWYIAKQQKDDGLVINLAGRQRMLIQQSSKAVIGYVAELREEKEAEKIADMVIDIRDYLANSIAKAKETGDFRLTESMFNFLPARVVHRIAGAFSKSDLFILRQVSIKYRNPNNKPDDYEAAVLAQMEIDPEKWKDRIWKEKVIENGKETKRLMKPFVITKACLNCHGSPETIPEVIKEKYPGDLATGYKEGDLRGAISVSWPTRCGDIDRLHVEMTKTQYMFESSMDALINGGKVSIGGEEFIVPACKNDQIRTQLVKEKGMWDKIVNATNVIFDKNADDITFNTAADYVLFNNGDLLIEVGKAVAMMQKQSKAKANFLLKLQIAAIAICGCFVLFAIRIVIRVTNDLNAEIVERKEAEEAIRKSEENLRKLQVSKQQLNAANEQLHAEISKREKVQEEKQKAQDRFVRAMEDIFKFVPEGLLVFSEKMELIRKNKTFEDIICQYSIALDFTEEQLSQKILEDVKNRIVNEENQIVEIRIHANEQSESKDIKVNELIMQLEMARMVIEEEEEAPAIVISLRDITEYKLVEEKAQKRQAELLHMSRLSTIGEIATDLAHELNQPLCAAMNYINACLHIVRAGNPNTDKLIENMEAVANQTERAGRIVNRIKDFVKKREPHQTTVDINKLIEGMTSFVHVDISKNKASLNLALSEELPLFLADPIQIEQVLLNLLLNGLEAMSDNQIEKRQLTIQTQMGDDHSIEVAISDTGKGVSAENLEKIFDSFFTTKPDGLGIGLSISQSIIDAHKGRLWATANPDCGMTFRFTLPIADIKT